VGILKRYFVFNEVCVFVGLRCRNSLVHHLKNLNFRQLITGK